MNAPEVREGSDLFLLLSTTPRPHRVVDFPRPGPGGVAPGSVAIWPLTQQEQMSATIEAERYAKKMLPEGKPGELAYDSTFSNEGAVQALYRACRMPEDLTKPAFLAPATIREAFRPDEITVLFRSYLTVKAEFSPIRTHLKDDEIDLLVREIAESDSTSVIDTLDGDVQRALMLAMARRLHPTRPQPSQAA